MTVVENNAEFNKKFGLSEVTGVVVTKVAQDARLGLQPGDLVLEVNRNKINSVADWNRIMSAKNRALGFLVMRQGQTLFISTGE